MNRFLVSASIAIVFSGASVLADETQVKEKPAFDAEKLMGTWVYESGVKNGEKLDKEHFAGQKVIFEKEKLTLKGEDTFVLKYKLDPKKNPIAISMEIVESPFGGGVKSVGILALDGDTLKLCYTTLPEGEAPKKFEAPENSGHHYFVLKRAKEGTEKKEKKKKEEKKK